MISILGGFGVIESLQENLQWSAILNGSDRLEITIHAGSPEINGIRQLHCQHVGIRCSGEILSEISSRLNEAMVHAASRADWICEAAEGHLIRKPVEGDSINMATTTLTDKARYRAMKHHFGGDPMRSTSICGATNG